MLLTIRPRRLLLALFSLWLICACTPNGIYHTVAPGQTLYRIARTYEISEMELARINRITDPRKLQAGQKLYIPGVTQPRHVAVPGGAATVRTPSVSPTVRQTTPPKAAVRKQSPSSTGTATKSTTSPAASPRKGFFQWPLDGKLVSSFGAKGKSTHKGIEIAVSAGTPVKAAASGKVIYSGDGIPGYGNLVILEHSDGYFTVYGFNRKNLVKMEDFVGKGDRIALSGQPLGGQSPRLYFEVRHGKSPVNPILYLP